MNGLFKMSQSSKKLIATVALAIVAIVFAITGVAMLKANAEPLSSAIVNEDGTLNTLTPPTNGGYYGVAHYEFNEGELGKDSLGNFDLTVGSGVTYDETYGGASLDGLMYAKKLSDDGTDFSDLVDGSFSISMRAYLYDSKIQNQRLICTGSYANSFAVLWRRSGFQVVYKDITANTTGNFNIGTNASSSITTEGNYLFDDTQSWYRITMIYDESALTYRTMLVREGYDSQTSSGYWWDSIKTLNMQCDFGGSNYSFTIGAQSKFGANVDQSVAAADPNPVISDLRIYSGVIDKAELEAIAEYDAANANADATDDNPTTAGMEKTLLANSSLIEGAYVRLTENSGLRFSAKLEESYLNKFITAYGEENVSFGVKLIRNHNGEKAYIYVPAVNNELVDGVYSFNAVITDLTQEYYATEFTAQVFVSYTVGGETTYVVSDIPVEEKVRSISSVAQMALDELGDTLSEEVISQLQAFIGQ